MPSDPVIAGRIGGSRNTPAQQAARKRNGFQKKQCSTVPATGEPTAAKRVIIAIPAPSNRKPPKETADSILGSQVRDALALGESLCTPVADELDQAGGGN